MTTTPLAPFSHFFLVALLSLSSRIFSASSDARLPTLQFCPALAELETTCDCHYAAAAAAPEGAAEPLFSFVSDQRDGIIKLQPPRPP